MNKAFIVRINICFCMAIILLCSYAYRITGDIIHEWIGVFLCLLFIVHNIFNYRWYRNLIKGVYTVRRIIITTINAMLIFTLATLAITGFMQSRTVLSFLNLSGGMVLRQIHTTSAYWSLPLVGIHIGIHWRIFSKLIGRNHIFITIMRILAVLFFLFGIWSFLDREMYAKLFLGFSFDYWPLERPAILFFIETLSIIWLYIFLAYYFVKLISWFKQKK